MSALLVLAGLFPPTPEEEWDPELHWQPIAYHADTSQHDHVSIDVPKCIYLNSVSTQRHLEVNKTTQTKLYVNR